MLKSKASRTTNEAVRETFSIKRCQSSIIFKEGESAQRVLALVAVVAAGIVCVLTAGIAAGSSAIGKFLYIRPIDIHIHHRTGSNLLAAATFHFGNKTYPYAGKSSVSCPLKPSDSAPLKHSTMPP